VKRKDQIILAVEIVWLAALVIMVPIIVINYEPPESNSKNVTVDDTSLISNGDSTAYFVYLWDDTNKECMQYSIPDITTFAALKKLTGHGIKVYGYGKQCCFWNDTCLTNSKLLPNYPRQPSES
jgi:hypothetical protein